MKHAHAFTLPPGWRILLKDLGIRPADVLRRAGLPDDLLTRFQHVLDSTREELARHYLTSSRLSGAEISFLLGFEDPNSFFRAFHAWTGQTPQQVRAFTASEWR